MIILPYCEKCGAEISEGDEFCLKCGASMKPDARPRRRDHSFRRDDELCFGEERDPLDALGFGFFLVIAGIIFYTYGNPLWDFISWVESMGDAGSLIKPPIRLLDVAYMFFGLSGLANLVTVALRFTVDRNPRRIMSDLLSGIGLGVFAYLISLYAADTLSFSRVIGSQAIVVGLLIIVYFLTKSMWKKG